MATYRIKPGLFLLMADEEPPAHLTAVQEGLRATGFDFIGGTGYRQYSQKMKEDNPNWRGSVLAPDQEFVILVGPHPQP